MKWRRVEKGTAAPPVRRWADWKPVLAKEAGWRCVYCAISEAGFGGIRNFHVDHFRPKSKFPHLSEDYYNLFYACAVCNTFKGSDWPGEPDPATATWVSPSENDFNDMFDLDPGSGEVSGTCAATAYMTEALHLNRQQLVLERRLHLQLQHARALVSVVAPLMTRLLEEKERSKRGNELASEAVAKLARVTKLATQMTMVRPYAVGDVR